MDKYLTTEELIKYILRSRFKIRDDEAYKIELTKTDRSSLEEIYKEIINQEEKYNNLKTQVLVHPKNQYNSFNLERFSISELEEMLNNLNAQETTTAGV